MNEEDDQRTNPIINRVMKVCENDNIRLEKCSLEMNWIFHSGYKTCDNLRDLFEKGLDENIRGNLSHFRSTRDTN
jgi:hypothetical protein